MHVFGIIDNLFLWMCRNQNDHDGITFVIVTQSLCVYQSSLTDSTPFPSAPRVTSKTEHCTYSMNVAVLTAMCQLSKIPEQDKQAKYIATWNNNLTHDFPDSIISLCCYLDSATHQLIDRLAKRGGIIATKAKDVDFFNDKILRVVLSRLEAKKC